MHGLDLSDWQRSHMRKHDALQHVQAPSLSHVLPILPCHPLTGNSFKGVGVVYASFEAFELLLLGWVNTLGQ